MLKDKNTKSLLTRVKDYFRTPKDVNQEVHPTASEIKETPTPYNLYRDGNNIYVVLSNRHTIPYFPDNVNINYNFIAIDFTDPTSYKTLLNMTLCWDILNKRHCFIDPINLHKVGKGDAWVLFNLAVNNLRSDLSLLKEAQKLCGEKYFEPTIYIYPDGNIENIKNP